MADILEARSRLTSRYQTTIPEAVRRALRLGKGETIRFVVRDDGEVVLRREEAEAGVRDPALVPFLDLLARDIADHPERLQAVTPDWADNLHRLVEGVEIDLDAPLEEDEDPPEDAT